MVRKKKIMVVDDEQDVLVMLHRLFEREGYEVMEAHDGDEALRLFEDSPADLVITDIQMPRKSGPLFILELRNAYPAVKIIAISGGGVEHLDPEVCLDMAVSLDVDDALSKPFYPRDILKAVRKQIGG